MMNELRKFTVVLFGIVLTVLLTILVMIYGWGLTPKSWWWIIGIGFFGQILAQLIIRLGLTSKD